jgi:hypothetical protein
MRDAGFALVVVEVITDGADGNRFARPESVDPAAEIAEYEVAPV